MAFDDIAQQRDIDIAPQQVVAVALVQSLGLRETTSREVVQQVFFQGGALGLGQTVWCVVRFAPAMAQVLAKAEGLHQGLHGPALHAGGNFTGEPTGRGA